MRTLLTLTLLSLFHISIWAMQIEIVDSPAIEARDEQGNTWLLNAIRNADWPTIESMLDGGADPNASNQQGDSILHRAVLYNRHEVLDHLLANLPATLLGKLFYHRNGMGLTPHELALCKNQTLAPVLYKKILELKSEAHVATLPFRAKDSLFDIPKQSTQWHHQGLQFDLRLNQNIADVTHYIETLGDAKKSTLAISDLDGAITDDQNPKIKPKARKNALNFVYEGLAEVGYFVVASAYENPHQWIATVNALTLDQVFGIGDGIVQGLCTKAPDGSDVLVVVCGKLCSVKRIGEKDFSRKALSAWATLTTEQRASITHVIFDDDRKDNLQFFYQDILQVGFAPGTIITLFHLVHPYYEERYDSLESDDDEF